MFTWVAVDDLPFTRRSPTLEIAIASKIAKASSPVSLLVMGPLLIAYQAAADILDGLGRDEEAAEIRRNLPG
jgi:hypothetical protein